MTLGSPKRISTGYTPLIKSIADDLALLSEEQKLPTCLRSAFKNKIQGLQEKGVDTDNLNDNTIPMIINAAGEAMDEGKLSSSDQEINTLKKYQQILGGHNYPVI